MAVSISQFKNGLTITVNGGIFQVLEFQHVKPGKGGAFVRTKLRNLRNNTITEKTFKGEERIEEAFVEEKKFQYLYHKNKIYYFMDLQTFEELNLSEELLKDKIKFLKDALGVSAFLYKGEILNINLPNFVDYKITYTQAGIRGDTVKAGRKSATLETGAAIQVPLFIKTGDTVKVDTRSKEYIERINI